MESFLRGAVAMGCAVAGLFFLRFWRQTRDRLFLIFALAFWVFALSRTAAAFIGDASEAHTFAVYALRLAAFVLILLAIADKNRARP